MTDDTSALSPAVATEDAAWPHWLGRRLGLALAAKVVALALLWYLFFAPELRPPADAAQLCARLLPHAPDHFAGKAVP